MNQKTVDPDANPDPDNHSHDPENHDTESKSQRKRNAHLITQLAAQLVEMKPKALAALPIEPVVHEAIRHCAEIKAHGARKRQLHFVSKLLRESGNAQELQSLLQRPDLPKKNSHEPNPHLEFRNRLIDNFADQVDALREHYPLADLQQVRQLVRNAHNESRKANKKTDPGTTNLEESPAGVLPQNTRSAKTLLRLLKDSSE